MTETQYGINRAKIPLMNAKDNYKGLRTATPMTRKWLRRPMMAAKVTKKTLECIV